MVKKNYSVIFFSILGILMCTFLFYSIKNSYAIDSNDDLYELNTLKVQTVFYKNGIFTSKGLEVNKLDGDRNVIETYEVEVENVPDLSVVGNKEVIVTYDNQKLSYNISVIDNNPGDIITLKDGSKWYFLEDSDGTTKLLSVYYLKEVCENSDDCYLTFLDKDDLDTDVEGKEAPYDNVYKTKYNESDSNKGYKESDVKRILDSKFSALFLDNLIDSNIDEKIISKMEITLPDAVVISRVGGISNFDVENKVSSGYSLNKTSLFLSMGKPTYWLMNKTGGYAWIVNNNSKLWHGGSTSYSFALRPQITIDSNLIKEIIIESSNEYDGELDNITAPNYIIYDVTNDVVIRENKSEAPTGNLDTIFPASMTKVTTAILALEMLEEKGIDLKDTVTIHKCISIVKDEYTRIQFKPSYANLNSGDVVTYEDLIAGVMFPSGWDATNQLAITLMGYENVIGTDYNSCKTNVINPAETDFSKEMTNLVKSITSEDSLTNYKNSSGLMDKSHVSTLYDTAKMMAYAMKNEFFKYLEQQDKWTTKNGVTYIHPSLNYFKKLDYFSGNKLGYVSGSGYNSLYNNVAYYSGPTGDYVIVIATANCSYNRNSDQLYAYQWLFPGQLGSNIDISYTVDYDSNGGTGTVSEQIFTYNVLQKLTKNTFTKEGYAFNGWNTKADGSGISYSDEQEIKLIENVTLYAQWEIDKQNYVIKNYIVDEDNKYIKIVNDDTIVEDFEKNIDVNNGFRVEVDYKTVNGKKLVYTGGKTKFYKNNELYIEYINIVRGDTSGDGQVTLTDLVQLRKHIVEWKNPETGVVEIKNGVYFYAIDLNDDDKISLVDLVRIRKLLVGISID